jgi:hypothetical protein
MADHQNLAHPQQAAAIERLRDNLLDLDSQGDTARSRTESLVADAREALQQLLDAIRQRNETAARLREELRAARVA